MVLDYGDAVANVTEHRGFSHSLFVLTGLAALLSVVSARLAPARIFHSPAGAQLLWTDSDQYTRYWMP